MDLREGPVELGRYRLLRRLGVGGMAEVYQGELEIGEGCTRQVAVKLLLPHLQDDQRFVDGFIDEANIAVQLSHPNIIEVYDFGQAQGTFYLTMEYIEGWDLRRLLQRRSRLPVGAAAYIVHELARALDYIHTRQPPVIHRDVTPHNVFCTAQGQVKLGDFGVAKAAARLTHTEAGQIKGKLPYLAPEQVAGDPVTPRTDVFAAGLVLFELLTGRRLNRGTSQLELLQQARTPERIRPSSLVPEAAPLDELTLRLLERHPAVRLPSAALLEEALRAYLEAHPFDAASLQRLLAEDDLASSAVARKEVPTGAAPAAGSISGGLTELRTRSFYRQSTGSLPLTPGTDLLQPPQPRRRAGWPIWAAALAGGTLTAYLSFAVVQHLYPSGPAALARVATGPGPEPVPVADRSLGQDGGRAPARVELSRADRPAGPTAPDLSPADAGSTDLRPAPGSAAPPRRKPARLATPLPSGASEPVRPAPIPEPKVAPGSGPDLPAARQALLQVLASARARGLLPGDEPLFDRFCAEARQAIEAGRDAALPIERARRHQETFRIDRAFAERKLARLEQMIARARPQGAEKERLAAAERRILKLILAERLQAASQLISTVAGQLRSGASQPGGAP